MYWLLGLAFIVIGVLVWLDKEKQALEVKSLLSVMAQMQERNIQQQNYLLDRIQTGSAQVARNINQPEPPPTPSNIVVTNFPGADGVPMIKEDM